MLIKTVFLVASVCVGFACAARPNYGKPLSRFRRDEDTEIQVVIEGELNTKSAMLQVLQNIRDQTISKLQSLKENVKITLEEKTARAKQLMASVQNKIVEMLKHSGGKLSQVAKKVGAVAKSVAVGTRDSAKKAFGKVADTLKAMVHTAEDASVPA